jgi:integrase
MATIKRRPGTGRWQVRYRDPAGRSRSRTYARKVDAQRFLETNEADKIRGDWIDPQAGRVTFAEYAQRWQATRMDRSPWTRRQDASVLRSLILPTFGERAVSSIRESEVSTWLATLGSADSTRAKAIQKFSAVMAMAVADGAIKSNPADGVKRPSQAAQRVGIALADDDVMAVIAAAEIEDERNAAMVVVLARLGLRVGEAMALRRSDIDFARGRLRVERSLNRLGETVPLKGRRRAADGRWVPLPVDVQDRLRAHLGAEAVAPIEGWLFTNGRGRPISYSNYRRREWQRITERAGLSDLVMHDLRHSFVSRAFLDGWTVPHVQSYVGHVDPTMALRIYAHVRADELPTPSPLRSSAGVPG